MFVACFIYFLIISDTLKLLTSSCLGSCQLTFHSSLTIQSYARPINILSIQTIVHMHVLGFNTTQNVISVLPIKKQIDTTSI